MSTSADIGQTEIRDAVRDHYARAARAVTRGGEATVEQSMAARLYAEQAGEVPDTALAASMGCGNPTMLAELRPGDTVLDLGSGGGIDVLLSARRVGSTGRAYGLDMTDEMLELARRNAAEAGATNVEFLKGQIERIPLPDASVDVIISNCVINLSGDKDAVFAEAHRVLRPGGRLAVSDIVLLRPLMPAAQRVVALWTGCVAGALVNTDYQARLAAAGFVDVEVQPTQVADRAFLENTLATRFPDLDLPEGLDLPTVAADLDGVITSSFIRATRS